MLVHPMIWRSFSSSIVDWNTLCHWLVAQTICACMFRVEEIREGWIQASCIHLRHICTTCTYYIYMCTHHYIYIYTASIDRFFNDHLYSHHYSCQLSIPQQAWINCFEIMNSYIAVHTANQYKIVLNTTKCY